MVFRRRVSALVIPLVLLNLLTGCGGWRTSETIRQEITERNGRAKVRATLWDSRRFVLRNASIGNGRLVGRQETEITRSSAGEGTYVSGGEVEIPLTEIQTLELHAQDGAKTALLVGGLVAVTVALIMVGKGVENTTDIFPDQ